MQSAFDTIIDTYDYETCKEIARHGCQSGVCSEHIYYADTVKFFEKHAEEITGYIKDTLGVELMKDLFGKSEGDFTYYMNDMTWCFIELVAQHVVDDYEDAVTDLEEVSNNYMKEEISNNGYTASDLEAIQNSKWGKDHLVIVNS